MIIISHSGNNLNSFCSAGMGSQEISVPDTGKVQVGSILLKSILVGSILLKSTWINTTEIRYGRPITKILTTVPHNILTVYL